jgi:hypothetical protein
MRKLEGAAGDTVQLPEDLRRNQPKGRSLGCQLQFSGAENGLVAIRLQFFMALLSAARRAIQVC